MAVAEAQAVATRECPACGGAMEQTQTICAQCRAELEAHVMSAPAPVATVAVNIAPAVTVRPIPQVAQPSASLRPPATVSPTPTRAPAQPVGRLESKSRWQHSVIAIGLVVLAAGVALGLWSFLTPHGDAEPAQPPVSPPVQQTRPPAPVVPAEASALAPAAQPKLQPATAPTTAPVRTVRPATRPANRPTTKPAVPRAAQAR